MWLLTMASEPPKIPEPIQIVIKQPEVEQPLEEKIYTIEEKIKLNYYNCNEAVEWIRADTAQCLAKSVVTARTTENQSKTIKNASNATNGWYPKGQCTWLVASMRPVGNWNDASEWLWQAKRDGWATGTTAQPGAIAWKYNHVAYVNSVDGDQMTITEANYNRRGSIRTITIPVSDYTAFIY